MQNNELNIRDTQEEYLKICKVSDLTDNRGKKFVVGEVEVAVFKIGDDVFAVNNICPHQHMSIIHEGFVEEDYVFCPAHCWEFNLKDGKMKNGRRGLDCYETKVVDGYVYAKVYQKKLNW